ncbi:helix-turn-helix domain-containing protein [Corynebacterium hindlerae]|uniref:Helix-turn-helix domain-containing protein n=1 Tax=Corynebacterium hindlerae TaxID=699041 RepID=A0A7G5FI99_9CORY|nr:helix-turn-helix domain-containing protein [Corynebacterium hindlerae]QMV86340.1 helix-turn-helix domain-containing protein [Corynebacterium hindlerae]
MDNEAQLKQQMRRAGALIRDARKATRMSQQQLADIVGVSRSWIGRVEAGVIVEGGVSRPVVIAPDALSKIALSAGADVGEVLNEAFRDSNIVAKYVRPTKLDVSDLSAQEVRLVVNLIQSIREQFHEQDTSNAPTVRKPNIDS